MITDSQLRKLKSNGLYIKYIKKQTHPLCMIAVKENYHAFKYIKKLLKFSYTG